MTSRNVRAALQVVRAQRGRTLLLGIPVALTTGLALATLVIDHGLTARAEAAARSFGTDVISIRPGARVIAGKTGPVSTLTDEDVSILRARLRRAVAVEGTRIEDGVPVSYGGMNGLYRIFAVRPPWAGVRDFGAARGEFLDVADVDTSARVAIIGQTVARELFGERDPLGAEIVINQVPFRVKGVLVAKGSSPAEGDRDARIVIPITTFYDRLYRRVHLDQIVVQAENDAPDTLAALEGDIRTILRAQHRLSTGESDDFTIRLPETIADESRGVSRSVFSLLFVLALVGAVVSMLIIGLVTQQSLKARQGEIGIRRAIGALPEDIHQQVTAEGLAVSVVGGLIGVAAGLLAAWPLALSQGLAMGVDAWVVIGPLVLVTLAAAAGIMPARAAARLDPAVALRAR
jgi:putative ABC transport system permease protein